MTNKDHSFGNSIAVASLIGSLPMGGTKQKAQIFALEDTPKSLKFNLDDCKNQKKENIDLNGFLAFTIDNVITKGEADVLILLTEELGYREDAPGIHTPPGMRKNKTVHWVSEGGVLRTIFERISSYLPAVLDGKKLSSKLSHRINFYKYDSGDIFNLHVDGDWPGYGLSGDGKSMVQWNGVHSKLTMLLYLNGIEDGIQGGKTNLFGRHDELIEVAPKKGRALFFRHGSGAESVLHEGSLVLSTVPKYVARINVMYETI